MHAPSLSLLLARRQKRGAGIITQIQAEITPAAYGIVTAQAAFSGAYYAQQVSNGNVPISSGDFGGEAVWRVSRQAAPEVEPDLNEGGDALYAARLDEGYPSGNTEHYVSCKRCTCQFPTCWKLPCRHITRVHMLEGRVDLIFEFGQHWRVQGGADLDDRMQLLARIPHREAREANGSVAVLSVAELRESILPSFKEVQRLCKTPEDRLEIEEALCDLIANLRLRHTSDVTGMVNPETQGMARRRKRMTPKNRAGEKPKGRPAGKH